MTLGPPIFRPRASSTCSIRLGLLVLARLGLGRLLGLGLGVLRVLGVLGLAALEDVVVLADDVEDERLAVAERRPGRVKVREVVVIDDVLDFRRDLVDLSPVLVNVVRADLLVAELGDDVVEGLVVHVVLLRVLLVVGPDREEEAERLAREDIDRLGVHLGRACVRFACDLVAESEVCVRQARRKKFRLELELALDAAHLIEDTLLFAYIRLQSVECKPTLSTC